MKYLKLILILSVLITSNLFANELKQPLKKVSLQLMWLDQFEFAGFYVAKEMGYYKEVGLDVEFVKYTNTTDITQNVLDKKADFGTHSSSLIIEKANGKDIIILGSIFQSSPLMLMGLEGKGLNTLEDIKNKRVMLAPDQERFATLQAMLASRNVQIKDIKILKHSFNVDDLINDKTDLMLAYTTNEPYVLKEKGYESKIFHPKDYGFDFYENIIFTTGEFANENPETVAKFYEASMKGWEYAFDNIADVSQLIFDKYNPQNKSLNSLIYEGIEMRKLSYTPEGLLGEVTKEKIKLIEHSYRILGLLEKPLDINSLVYTKHLNKVLTLSNKEKTYLENKKQINMCIDPLWMPFEKNENGKHIGVSADYFKLLEEKLGIPIKMIPTQTWTQSLEYGKARKCDIFSLVMPTPERLLYLDFTKAYLNVPLVIASDLHTTFVDSLEQVSDKKLAIVKGYAYGELLRNRHPNIEFVDVANIKDGLEKVKKGEVFGFIGSLATVGYEIQNNYIGQLKITGKFKDTWNLGIGTRNDEPILKDIFEKAMDTISYETRQSILNKWVSVNYDKGINYDVIVKVSIGLFIIIILLILIYRQYLLNDLNRQLNQKVKEEIEKNSEQQKILSQQSKMAAMGEMIGNIAHQWRQPLSTISIVATGMQFRKDMNDLSDEEFKKSIESIKKSTLFLSDTIDDFRNFFSTNQVYMLVRIPTLMEKAFDLFGVKFTHKDITLIQHIEDIEINTYENELIQVIINLLNNSNDVIKDLDEKLIFVDVFSVDDKLIITIRDNGGGIDEEVLPRIFEPYFTTKHKSQGTGIGLYMSEQIINKHMDGNILVQNSTYDYNGQTYTGAEFVIEIPIN